MIKDKRYRMYILGERTDNPPVEKDGKVLSRTCANITHILVAKNENMYLYYIMHIYIYVDTTSGETRTQGSLSIHTCVIIILSSSHLRAHMDNLHLTDSPHVSV